MLSDRLWDDLLALWQQSLHEQDVAEDATGDAELLAARTAVARAETRVGAAFQARRDWRRAQRRGGSTPEIEAEITAALDAAREARGVLWPVLRRVRLSIREDLRGIWRERDLQMRAVAQGKSRRYPELHDGVYNDVHKRFCTAAREGAKKGIVPKPSARHSSQSIYRQLQARTIGGVRVPGPEGRRARIEGGRLEGATWGRLLAKGWRGVRLAPWTQPRTTHEWRLLEVPADATGTLIRLPVRIARPLPDDTLIKAVRIVRRGSDWHAVLSVAAAPPAVEGGTGTLYGGLNWRLQIDDSLRVFDGVGDDGVRYQVCLPDWQVAAARYAELFQGALDRRAVEAAERLCEALPERRDEIAEHAARKRWPELYALDPAWADGTHAGRAKSIHGLLIAARRRSFGSAEKYAAESAEVLGDRKGRAWLAGQRAKALRRREHHYRECARWIAERFGRVVLAASDGSQLARVVDERTGAETALPLPARHQRRIAAPYSLEQAIRWALRKAGTRVVDAVAVDRSRTCPLCARRMDAPQRAGELYLHCLEHGRWDRDHALAASLWRDDLAETERERWAQAMRRGQRSQAQIVRIDAEVEPAGDGVRPAYSRLRYVAGLPLAKRPGSRDGTRG
jgi:hypothetical protein